MRLLPSSQSVVGTNTLGPQRFAASGDAYTKRMDEITEKVHNKIRIVDDTSASWLHVCIWTCVPGTVWCSTRQVQIWEKGSRLCGFTVTYDGVKPTKKVKGDCELPKANKLEGGQGMIQPCELGCLQFCMTEDMAPFLDLLKRNKQFYWDDTMDELFERGGEAI